MLCRTSGKRKLIANIWCAWQQIWSETHLSRHRLDLLRGRFEISVQIIYASLLCFVAILILRLFFVIYVLGSWRAYTCSCVRVRTHMCGSVISSSFKSCHRPDTIVRRAFHRLTSDVPVIQSNYTERNRYCYTLGIDSRQNRKVEIRLQPSTAMWTWSLNTPHLLPAQIWNHMDEQLQSLGDNKSSRWLTSVLGGQFWQAAFSNLK